MAYHSLSEFIERIEAAGELVRIKTRVSTELEIAEIADRMSKAPGGGKALLFENNGTDFPVLINGLGSLKRMHLALNVNNFSEISDDIEALFKKMTGPKKSFMDKLKMLPELAKVAKFMPKTKGGKGASQEVIHKNPDLSIIPVLKTWSRDGGKFITFPQVITQDPHTGIRNIGMYRLQILSKNETGMHWHKHKVGERHYREYKALGEKMPIAVALGGDPACTYSAVAPLPDNVDEYMLAGFLRKQKVTMVKAITQDIYVPAEADFIIEGYVDPLEEKIWEGPFGDHTGFFSLADWYPKFHVTCITHRKQAIYPATVVGIPPMEDAYIARATGGIFKAPIKITMLPEMEDMNIPDAGVAHNLTLVSIHKTFSGHAQKIINSLWGAGQMMFNKMLLTTDASVNVHDYKQLAQYCSQHIDPQFDIHFMRGPLDVLDHSSSKFAFGSKIGIDATKKYPEEISGEKVANPKLAGTIINTQSLKEKYPALRSVNLTLLEDEISAIFISIEKTKGGEVRQLAQNLFSESGIKQVKFIFSWITLLMFLI